MWYPILAEALYTPSPHNVQPWRVRVVSEDRAELFIEAGRTLPCGDTTGSFLLLTMAMFVEAVRISAALHGQRLCVSLCPYPNLTNPITGADTLLPFAHLTLVPGEPKTDVDLGLLWTRRTSRRADYRPELPVPGAVAALQAIAQNAGQTFTLLTDPAQIEPILESNTKALLADLNTPDYHGELVRWFRFSDRQAKASRDGLSFRCMNTPQALFWWAARFPQTLRPALLRPFVQRVYRRQMGTVPALGIVSGPFWKPEEAVSAGAFLLRFWLELARQDLFIHPFGNLVTNRNAAAFVRRATGIENVWFVFRVGYCPQPLQSLRRNLEEVLVP